MKAQEIREVFLDFFQKKGHKTVKSSPLLPKDDPTILFTNAGMNQFKDIFLGLEKRSYARAASVQKCMRVSGKHNDLEQVGKTNKHHTFFEMLGNFSFGDYFKEEAIAYAWELFIDVLKLDRKRLYFTVYTEDDEAYRIWEEDIGIPSDRIFRFGKKDNYWAMGETGPCGPCSEIHYDLGENIEEGDPYSLIESGDDRFFELWNLVFMEFHQDEKGGLHPLPSPSIDTGMGMERLATVLQGTTDNYGTDLFLPLQEAVAQLAGQEGATNDKQRTAMRIIADHVRAVTFLIGDGIMPSNEGRGYVLRRLIRRAFRNGKALGLEDPFLFKLVSVVTDIMKDAYPELLSSAQYISKICLSEEKRFALTLSSGLKTFRQFIKETKDSKKTTLPGEKAFKLYDTYGFPLDLSKELAEEENIDVDEKGFQKELEQQKQKARESWTGDAGLKEKKAYERLKDLPVQYVGYDFEKASEAKVLALLKEGEVVDELGENEQGEIVLDITPFYAEAGGQAGDSGILKNPHFSAVVETAYFPIPEIISHKIKVLSGIVKKGDVVEAAVDSLKRKAVSKNHTATHLLHAALKQVLGDHVKQSGSLVMPSRLRFDFTHFSSLSHSELRNIELMVNEKIQENISIRTKVLPLEEGLKEGAVAIFEEKYGEDVRMVAVGDFSKELCGGVHVHSTGDIGMFKILSESSIAAGMRRIEALTGDEAIKYTQEAEELLSEIQHTLNSPRESLVVQVEKLKDQLKDKEKENKSLRHKLVNLKYEKEEEDVRMVKGIPVLVRKVEGLNNTEIRELADNLKQKIHSGVVILGTAADQKAFVVISVSKDLIDRIQANEFIKKAAPLIGGGGGGRADFAQAGGSRPENLSQLLEKSCEFIESFLE
jgi:alanyl-tRNA synthetase